MRKSKIAASILAVFLLVGVITAPIEKLPIISVSADASKETNQTKSDIKNGWYTSKSTGKKMYYLDGEKIVSKTKKIDGKIYLFDSDGYLLKNGFHTIKGNKYYSDKNGVVLCNQWVAHKFTNTQNTYYYADSKGKVTKYSFKPENKNSYSLIKCYNLYINDELATKSALRNINTKGTYTFDCFYRFENDYYYIFSYSENLLRVKCSETANLLDLSFESNYMYDFGSGKYLGEYYGVLNANNQGKCYGKLYNKDDGYIYTINNNGKKATKNKAGSLVIIESDTDLNSVGGVDYDLTVVNNSSKTIKYIYYKVYVKNAVDDIVRCRITDNSYFNLKDTGPYKPGEVSYGGWKAIMYNYSADKVVISSVTIEYMDGTSITINGSKLSSLK